MEQAQHGHVDEREDAQHEVDLVVDEHFALNVGEQRCEPVRGVRRNDIEQQQNRCAFCDMSVQTGPRLRVGQRNDMELPTCRHARRPKRYCIQSNARLHRTREVQELAT